MTLRETETLWRLGTLIKYGLVGFLILMLVAMFIVPRTAWAEPPGNRPPDNRPPDRPPQHVPGDSNVEQSTVVDVGTDIHVATDVSTGDNVLSGGSQTVNIEFPSDGVGSQSSPTTQTVDGDTVSLDAGDSPVNIDTGGNSHESNFFAFSTGFPQASGCFSGTQGGGGGDGGTGFLGFHWLNNDCWMSQLSSAQKGVWARARLDCGSKKFRNAIAYDQPGKERQHYCVQNMETQYELEIEVAIAAVDSALASGELEVAPSPK